MPRLAHSSSRPVEPPSFPCICCHVLVAKTTRTDRDLPHREDYPCLGVDLHRNHPSRWQMNLHELSAYRSFPRESTPHLKITYEGSRSQALRRDGGSANSFFPSSPLTPRLIIFIVGQTYSVYDPIPSIPISANRVRALLGASQGIGTALDPSLVSLLAALYALRYVRFDPSSALPVTTRATTLAPPQPRRHTFLMRVPAKLAFLCAALSLHATSALVRRNPPQGR